MFFIDYQILWCCKFYSGTYDQILSNMWLSLLMWNTFQIFIVIFKPVTIAGVVLCFNTTPTGKERWYGRQFFFQREIHTSANSNSGITCIFPAWDQ